MTGPWQPSDYRDTYTDRVNDLIEAKKNDDEFQPASEAPPGTTVVDLTEALRASRGSHQEDVKREARQARENQEKDRSGRASQKGKVREADREEGADRERKRPDGQHVSEPRSSCRGDWRLAADVVKPPNSISGTTCASSRASAPHLIQSPIMP